MNIVLVDSGQLMGMPEFPPINLPKFAWLEYVDLAAEEIDERCWRADVIVSTNTIITADVIKDTYKLKLIIAAGDNYAHIDVAAAKEREVVVCNVPGLIGDNVKDAQEIAIQVVDNIHAWLDERPINQVI